MTTNVWARMYLGVPKNRARRSANTPKASLPKGACKSAWALWYRSSSWLIGTPFVDWQPAPQAFSAGGPDQPTSHAAAWRRGARLGDQISDRLDGRRRGRQQRPLGLGGHPGL